MTGVPTVSTAGRHRATSQWSVLGPLLGAMLAVGGHLLAGARLGDRVATAGEAQLAAAAFAGRGAPIGPVPLGLPDSVAAWQLALVEGVLPASGISVLDAARWSALGFGLLAVLLLWPLLERLGTGATAIAVTLGVVGAVPLVTDLHGAVAAGGPAALWIVVAAVAATSRRRPVRLLAAPAAVLAVVTAPLAGVLVLGLAAHLLGADAVRLRPVLRTAVAAVCGLLALVVAVLAAGSGPLAGVGGPVVGTPAAVLGAVVGLVLVVPAWRRARWLRPVLSPVVLVLIVLLVPGPGRAAAALLLLPVTGVVLAALVEVVGPEPARHRTALARAVLAGVVLAVVTATSAAAAGQSRATSARDDGIAGWIRTQLPAGTTVHADALDRGELVAAGIPPEVLAPPGGPVDPGDVVLHSARPTGMGTAEPPLCRPEPTLAVVARGAGGAPAVLCGTDSGQVTAVRAEAPRRVRLGDALAANPALDLAPDAAALLRNGQVDARLVLVLAALAGSRPLAVADFPAVPLDPADALRRQVLVTAVDGGPDAGDRLAGWLAGQQPPFVPSTVRPVDGGLLIGYPAPASTGLLPT